MLRAVTENVLLEIQKTFDFFKATAASDQIDRIMLSGGASRVDGFREMLAGAVRARRSRSSIRSATSPGTPKKLGRRAAGRCADGGGRCRPRAPKGGRPMIRINLLGVERQKAQAARRVRRSASSSRSPAA